MTDIKVTPNSLPLPLKRLQSERPASSALPLPLPLNRKLGTLEPVVPVIKRTMVGAFADFSFVTTDAKNLGNCAISQALAINIGNDVIFKRLKVVTIASCQLIKQMAFVPISNCHHTIYTASYLLSACFVSVYRNFIPLANLIQVKISDTVGYSSCSREILQDVIGFNSEIFEPLQPVINYGTYISPSIVSKFVANCHTSNVQAAIPVPCRYYPIPDPPPPPVLSVCRLRPPSSRLPLPMTRRRGEHPSSALPLPLLCWHDDLPTFIPSLRSYIVHNTLTATIGGTQVDLSGFDIKADTNGFCWQGKIDLTPSQFKKVQAKLDVEIGKEPLITVNVNGFVFAFLAEDMSRNRQFINHTYSISGRSITARLGADYAHAQGLNGTSIIDQDLYASQIVQQQLADTGIVLDKWAVPDWLIPANTYSLTNKTALAVIADIAKACGGFIFSHPSEAKLSILPLWRKPAWELATAIPDVVLIPDVWQSINDTTRKNPRYNTITLVGAREASEVYRNRQGRDRIAPIDNNPLYTDRDCVVAKGTQLLSDSGTHGNYTVKMRWAEKYNIALANLSDIWQVNDPEGVWNGTINSVAVNVDWNDDVPCLWQTVGIDRYLDV